MQDRSRRARTSLYTIERILHDRFCKYRLEDTEWFVDPNEKTGEGLFRKVCAELERLFESPSFERANDARIKAYESGLSKPNMTEDKADEQAEEELKTKAEEEKSKSLKNAIKNNYVWRKKSIENKLKEKYKECILLFGVGLLFLILSFVIIPLIKSESNFISLLGESSSIVGWVFMWDLVEILSFEVTKLHKKRRYLNRLINSKVEFETY